MTCFHCVRETYELPGKKPLVRVILCRSCGKKAEIAKAKPKSRVENK